MKPMPRDNAKEQHVQQVADKKDKEDPLQPTWNKDLAVVSQLLSLLTTVIS